MNSISDVKVFPETNAGFEETHVAVREEYGVKFVALRQSEDVIYVTPEVLDYLKSLHL